MASTASDLLKFEKQTDGENDALWGQKANTAMSRLEEAIADITNISVTTANYTMDDTQYAEHDDSGGTSESHVAAIKATGALTGNRQIIVPLRNKIYWVWNATSAAYTLTVIGATGTGVAVPQGYLMAVICDGTNVEALTNPITSAGAMALIGALDANGNMVKLAKGADVASGTSLPVLTDGNYFDVTGTSTITSIATQGGDGTVCPHIKLHFDGALTLTHHATDLILPGGANITTAAGDEAEFVEYAAGDWRCVKYQRATGLPVVDPTVTVTQVIAIAVSDETTALTTGTAKATFRMPFAFTLTDVRASVTTAPTGSVLTVDLNEGGTTILSTKITIDASEKTSTTAAAAPVISDAALADDAEITVDIDSVGSSVAGAGLKIYLIGNQ